jgi:cellulose 1,4-beta-cellobiosidase
MPPTVDISPKPPGAPADLHVTELSSTSVTLAWTAAAGGCCGVDGYDISYHQAFNDVMLTQAVGNVTTATVTSGIRPTGQYSFQVSARDSVGHRSASSNTVVVVTPASDTAADQTPPSAPTALTIVANPAPGSPSATPGPGGSSAPATPGTVRPNFTLAPGTTTVSWTPSTDDVAVTGYDVYRFDGLYVSTLLATVTGTSYTISTNSMAPEIVYVRARDAAGNLSAASNTVTTHENTTSSPTASPSTPGPACQVEYRTTAHWRGGFTAAVTVTNTGAAAVDGWVLTIRFNGDERVVNAWNATFSQAGPLVTLTGPPWNEVLPPGGSASVGLLGVSTTDATPPIGGLVNGAACLAA